jgi:ABC-type uncharacterized transport system substrate-binding protein
MCSIVVAPLSAQPPARLHRIGVVLLGGPYLGAVDGLRDGLKDLGLEEGKQFVLQIHNEQGDLTAVEAAARKLEADKVDVIYSLSTSVSQAVKRGTRTVPIVFYAGTDPVAFGLVDSFHKPGGRITGIYGRLADLTAKRMELMKEMMPRLRRAVTIYNPSNPAAQQSSRIARDAAQRLKIELVERHARSVDELRSRLRALRPGEFDAFFYVGDAMVTSQVDAVIEAAKAARLPTMFQEHASVEKGALASYGVRYYTMGRLSAKQVYRVLLGTNPADVPVDQLDRLYFVVNLQTARAIGLTIPPSVLARADEVIQ